MLRIQIDTIRLELLSVQQDQIVLFDKSYERDFFQYVRLLGTVEYKRDTKTPNLAFP